MLDALALALSVAIPWVAGTLCIRAATGRARRSVAIAVGYGYLAGMFGVTLVMRALSLAGIRWGVTWIAVPVVLVALATYLRLRPGGIARDWLSLGALATLTGAARVIFVFLLALTCARVMVLALQVDLVPLIPFDAFAQWASKARVWYEYGYMVPFVSPEEWAKTAGVLHFTDTHPEYPGTVPLFQVWTALWIGRWDESLINAPWVAACAALGVACYAQLRSLGFGPVKAMFGAYVLLSLPYLTIHVALSGLADLFVAIAYGLAAIATWQWVITRDRSDAGLAVMMAIVCASVKFEGSFWALTLVPCVVTALNRRAGQWLMGAGAMAVALYLAFGPAELRLLGYGLRTRFVDVSRPLYEHLFVMDNWHLLWYAVVGVLVVHWRALFDQRLAPATMTMLTAVAFIFVVFFFSTASAGVIEEGITNRLVMHTVGAFVFYLALILRPQSERAERGAALAAAKPA